MAIAQLASKLSEAAKELPEAIRPDSLINFFKNRGVKDEEISLSGVGRLAESQEPVSRAAVDEALATRPDVEQFGNWQAGTNYNFVTLPGTNFTTYRERVYRDPRLTGASDHYPTYAENYSFHVRSDEVPANHTEIGTAFAQLPADLGSRFFRYLSNTGSSYEQASTDDVLSFVAALVKEVTGSPFADLPDELVHAIRGAPNSREAIRKAEDFRQRAAQAPSALRIQEIQSDVVNQSQKVRTLPEKEELIAEATAASELINGSAPDVNIVEALYSRNLDDDTISLLANELQPHEGKTIAELITIAEDFLASRGIRREASNFPYIRQALSEELVYAANKGLSEVHIAIKPDGVFNLSRSEGVQRNYETSVVNTAKKLAKKIGGTFEEKKGYVVIGLPAAGFSLDLYAEDGVMAEEDKNASFKRTALARGFSEEEVNKLLFVRRASDEFGLSREDAIAAWDRRIQQSQQTTQAPQQPPMAEMRPATAEDRLAAAVGARRSPMEAVRDTLRDPIGSAKQALNRYIEEQNARREVAQGQVRGPEESRGDFFQRQQQAVESIVQAASDQARPVSELVERLEETQRVARPWLETRALFGSEAAAEYAQVRSEIASNVIAMAEERGVPLEFVDGEYFTRMPNGETVKVTPGLLQTLYGDKFEIGLSMGGAATGALAGARLAPNAPIAKLAGSLVGAAVGAITGTQLDYMEAAIETQEAIEARLMFEKALGAGAASLTYDIAFGGALGLGKLAVMGTSAVYKTLKTGYDLAITGNRPAAVEALLTETHLSRGEAEELVNLWENLHRTSAPGQTMEDKMLAIIPTVAAGGENILAAVKRADPIAVANVVGDIDKRATDLLAAARSAADLDAAARVMTNFRNVVDQTSALYRATREVFTKGTLPTNQTIAFGEQTKKTMDSIIDTIPVSEYQMFDALIRRANMLIDRADNIANPYDLMEFRQQLNSIKYSGAVTNRVALEQLDELLGSVDTAMTHTAVHNMGEQGAKDWLKSWTNVRRQYSKIQRLEQNVFWRAITKDGFTPASIAKAFVDYGPTIDDTYRRIGGQPVNTFRQVVDELPASSQAEVENIIVRELTERYTAGREGQLRATQFPELARHLQQYDFQTPRAKQMQTVIEELAQVHQIDTALLMGSGNISFQAFQSYLTTDPVVRAQFAIASKVFNYAQQLAPGQEAKSRALINLTSKLLSEPLNARTVSDMLNEVADDAEFVQLISSLQGEIARQKASGEEYRGGLARVWKDSAGRMYLREAPGLQRAESIPMQRIATTDFVTQRTGISIVDAQSIADMPRSRKADLIALGFQAVALPNGQIVKLF